MDSIPELKQKKKNKSKKSRISFDEEFITKDKAVEFLSSSNNNVLAKNTDITIKKHNKKDKNHNQNSVEEVNKTESKKKKKKRKLADEDNTVSELSGDDSKIKSYKQNDTTEENDVSKKKKKKLNNSITEQLENATNADVTENALEPAVKIKKKSKKKKSENETVEQTEETPDETVDSTTTKKQPEESKRAQKRKKHAKLLEQKKLKSLLSMQQKSLNYLSQWKHNRAEWKFEKLRQVWLSQNMYNTARVPEEFWNTVVEYFSGSRGKVRDVILKNAVQIVKKNSGAEEGGENEGEDTKLGRARDIIKKLQT